MSETMPQQSGKNEWSLLLAEARQALSTLRADELTELAARADCMLEATLGIDSIRQRMPTPQGQHLEELTREHRRLGDLLAATHRNLKVLRGVRTDGRGCARTGEEDSRWVR
jgi:hypothetical protein